jgi:hypothetical protein
VCEESKRGEKRRIEIYREKINHQRRFLTLPLRPCSTNALQALNFSRLCQHVRRRLREVGTYHNATTPRWAESKPISRSRRRPYLARTSWLHAHSSNAVVPFCRSLEHFNPNQPPWIQSHPVDQPAQTRSTSRCILLTASLRPRQHEFIAVRDQHDLRRSFKFLRHLEDTPASRSNQIPPSPNLPDRDPPLLLDVSLVGSELVVPSCLSRP